MTTADLDAAVAAFGAQGVEGLQAIVERTPPTDAWIDALIGGVSAERSDVPATWLLRAYLQRDVELARGQTAALLRSLERIRHDDARLHICQLVTDLEIPPRNAEQLARFLREGASGDHKFTRAWATDAFHRLALQHPRYVAEARSWLERAHRDPAASVRARARRIGRIA